jgi:hypothetical protein
VSRARAWAVPLAFGLLFGLALARVSGFFTDDSYIHLVFARNLVRGEPLSFNPGEPVYGFTSPLWMLLLAAGHGVTSDWLELTRLLGGLFTIAAVGATFGLARAAGGSPGAAFLAAASLAFHAWFLRWSLSGMETSLAAYLAAAGLVGVLKGGRSVLAGLVALALAALARPEALILFAAASVWALWGSRRGGARSGRASAGSGRSRGDAAVPGAPARPSTAAAGVLAGLALLAGWTLWAHAVTDAWLPNAYTVKRMHEALTAGGVVHDTAYFLGVVGITDAIIAAAAVLSLWILRRRGERAGPLGLLLLWPALLAAFYLGARVQMISRYWVPAVPALCAAAWVGAERVWGARARGGAAALYFAQQAAVMIFLVVPQMDAFRRGLDRGPAEIGRWLKAHAAPGALVATPDIGAIGFYGERRVLDLGGLVTPAMAAILARHEIHEVIAGALYESIARPDYLVDRDARPGVLVDLPAEPDRPRYELIFSSRIENLGISRREPRYYSLYRVISPDYGPGLRYSASHAASAGFGFRSTSTSPRCANGSSVAGGTPNAAASRSVNEIWNQAHACARSRISAWRPM